ncbi:hypothetical protein TELCIR_23669, partial [Teladorsagia circumcincta]
QASRWLEFANEKSEGLSWDLEEPYDEDYLKSKDIKHMSFHAHVRKLTSGHGKGSQLKRPLENIRCTIDLNCPAHKPYPKGVCTKCKPPVMTLNRQ